MPLLQRPRDLETCGGIGHAAEPRTPSTQLDLVGMDVVFGPTSNFEQVESLLQRLKKRFEHPPLMQEICIAASFKVWTPAYSSKIFPEIPSYVRFVRTGLFDELSRAITIFTRERDEQGALISELAFPLDRASTANVLDVYKKFLLPDLEVLTLTAPLDPIGFAKYRLGACKEIRKWLGKISPLKRAVIALDCAKGVYHLLAALEEHHPNLMALEFASPNPRSRLGQSLHCDISSSIARLIRPLSNLQRVCLPDELISPNLLKSLIRLQVLKVLKIIPSRTVGVSRFVEAVSGHYEPDGRRFRSLKVLDISRGAVRISPPDFQALTLKFTKAQII